MNHVSAVAPALRGDPVYERRLAVDVKGEGVDAVFDHVAALVREALRAIEATGARCVGLGFASPGVIDVDEGVTRYAPKYRVARSSRA